MNGMQIWRAGVRIPVAVLFLASLAGCKPGEAVKQGAVFGKGRKPAAAGPDRATTGGLSGTVRFVGRPPARRKVDMSADPACAMTGTDNYEEQIVVHEGKLANVYVYVKSGPAAAMAAPPQDQRPVVMNQVGCRYVPHVVALMRGGLLEFHNSDATNHSIHTLPDGEGTRIHVLQRAGGPANQFQFNQSVQMLPVGSDLHLWMNGFIHVSDTPFFSVTDTDGHFEMEGLPAGTYVVGALHETMGQQWTTITVEPHQTAKTDFSFRLN